MAGTLTNTAEFGMDGTLNVGGLVESGRIDIAPAAAFAIAAPTTNNGVIALNAGASASMGALDGAGAIFLYSGSTLTRNSSVGSSADVYFVGAELLTLSDAKAFAASIYNFVVGDTIDVKNFGTGTIASFTENAYHSACVLTLTDDANVANIEFLGAYDRPLFTISVGLTDTSIELG